MPIQIPGPVHVTVRDGRIGRDPALVTEEGGEVLMEFDRDELFDQGDRVTLPDGTSWPMIGGKESYSSKGIWQTVFIGDE